MSDSRRGDDLNRRLFQEAEPGRKGEILAAALDVFGERGYEGGSMREIAGRIGVTEPALYRHFPSKEALFLSLMRIGAGRFRNELIDLISQVQPVGLRGQLVALLKDRREAVRFYVPLLRIVLPAATRHEAFVAEYRQHVVVPTLAALMTKAAQIDAALGHAVEEGDRAARVRALVSLMVGFMLTSFVLGDEPEEAIVDAALRVMRWEGN